MAGRRIACAALALVAALVAPAAAQSPEDEIEMEPEPAKPPAPPPAPAPTPTPPAPAPAQPVPGPDAAPAPAPEAPVKDPKVAKKWLTAGQTAVQKGDWFTRAKRPDDAKTNYEAALVAFQKSIEAGEDLNTYALLAEVEDKLGKPDLAVRHYRVVVKAETGIRPDVLKKATAKLDELSAKVGVITLAVTPEGATITLNGTELGKAPLAEPLILLPGTYALQFQADGFQPKEAELVVEGGAEAERAFELEAIKIIVQAPPPPEPAPPPKLAGPPSRIPLYAGGGAAIALLGTAVVTGILATGEHSTYVGADSTAIERSDARANGRTLARITDVALLGGLAAGGFTAYWYFVKYKPAQRKHSAERVAAPNGRVQATKLDLVPWVQSEASGLVLVGAF